MASCIKKSWGGLSVSELTVFNPSKFRLKPFRPGLDLVGVMVLSNDHVLDLGLD